mgnify:FL=1
MFQFIFLHKPSRTYLFNQLNNTICRLNGVEPSHRLPHKEELRQSFSDHVLYSAEQLPSKVDLRPFMTSVEDQSRIGSW